MIDSEQMQRKPGLTKLDTLRRMEFIKNQLADDLDIIKKLRVDFPMNREVWDSLSTIIKFFEVALMEVEMLLTVLKEEDGQKKN